MDISRLVELRDLQQKGVFDDYVKERWEQHKEAFREIAWLDGRDPARFPDFAAFYSALRPRLSEQEVRRGLRTAVRRRVSIERGEEILGDLSDDNVLREGVREVLRRLGEDPEAIPEYHSLTLNGAAKKRSPIAGVLGTEPASRSHLAGVLGQEPVARSAAIHGRPYPKPPTGRSETAGCGERSVRPHRPAIPRPKQREAR